MTRIPSDRKCSRCGNGSTRYNWYNEKDDKVCYDCHLEIEREKNRKIKEKCKEDTFKDMKCCLCGSSETYVKPDRYPDWRKYPNIEKWDRKSYMCKDCYNRSYYYDISKFDPESRDFVMNAQFRTGQLSIYAPGGKGFIGEMTIAKTLGLENCNIKMDKFNYFIDLSIHEKYGKIQVQIATLKNGLWSFTKLYRYLDKEFDNLFLLCMDRYYPWKNVERLYIIHKEDVIKRSSITIYKDPSRSVWYQDYQTDEKPYNDTYHNMKLENCNVLKKEN